MAEKDREGDHCTQCGKYIPEGEWNSRDGTRIRFFFRLFKKDKWLYYFCSEECSNKFWRKNVHE